ncbi:site-2 protease family protein [Clostridium novyi]|uniref:Sterol-regulatory element binding protein (SREBP) site 2 protease n=1 Tax=Clostridium novyi (strain NT) TaxID=386415 RepID=A0Q2J8_CLONN|nr:site-2 protease family protein [Clostridium novyi]ABK62413.1 Sterol-regulatory element binding protein (SREBP) site 2 protease [Clostridium novyi NT]KEH86397.1 peptidase [Clostridium novyi A str. NCTC 538]
MFSGQSFLQSVLNIILMIPSILIAFTFHEYAHALVAYKLGDDTPKHQGRLSLNPLVHIDIIGFLMLLFLNFGWAKPVETNPRAFKNYYKDDLKVSIAGVIGNLVAALLASIILAGLISINNKSDSMVIIISMIIYVIETNCLLVFLNLLPIPGFDGFHVLRDLFPKFFYEIEEKLYTYRYMILLVLLIPIPGLGGSIINFILDVPAEKLTDLFMKITYAISGIQ